MGLLDLIFRRPPPQQQRSDEVLRQQFRLFTGYQPVFSSYAGGLYEYEITRAAIHTFASHCSKLAPQFEGTARRALAQQLQVRANPWMDTTKFLYRLATILSVDNTAFVAPITDPTGTEITGLFPLRPARAEVVEDDRGQQWLRYTFANGQRAAIEWERVGVLTRHLFRDDLFGEGNSALNQTLQLLATNAQGIIEGVKAAASIRFLARLANVYKPEDIARERARFVAENLSAENNSGVLMFDNKYADVRQIDSRPFVVDGAQLQAIEDSVFSYFGTNKKIIQNAYNEDEWAAYYEGQIEPFALQLSLVMTGMLFSPREIGFGNRVYWTANRLQYASAKTKLSIIVNLFDRGFLTHNEGREMLNLPPRPDGDRYYLRLDYGPRQEGQDQEEVVADDFGR